MIGSIVISLVIGSLIALLLFQMIYSRRESRHTNISIDGAENYIRRKLPGVIELSYLNPATSRPFCVYIDYNNDDQALKKLHDHVKKSKTASIRHYPNKKFIEYEPLPK